jgi:hypothetical protein
MTTVTPAEEKQHEDWWRHTGKILEFDATRKEGESIEDYRDRMRRTSADAAERLRDRENFGERGEPFDD